MSIIEDMMDIKNFKYKIDTMNKFRDVQDLLFYRRKITENYLSRGLNYVNKHDLLFFEIKELLVYRRLIELHYLKRKSYQTRTDLKMIEDLLTEKMTQFESELI